MQLEALNLQANQCNSIPIKRTVDPIFKVTDFWVLILVLLRPEEVIRFALVSTRCTTLARNERVWQTLFKATFPTTFELESEISKDKAFMKDWYSAFQQRLYLLFLILALIMPNGVSKASSNLLSAQFHTIFPTTMTHLIQPKIKFKLELLQTNSAHVHIDTT